MVGIGDFENLAKQIIELGLPILGNALGGPLGGAVAGMVASAIGAPSSSATDISTTLAGMDQAVAIQKLQTAEAEYVAQTQADAAIAQSQTQAVSETIRAELLAAGVMTGRLGTFIEFMQLSWRPLFAYETLLECAGMAIIMGHEVWTGDFKTMNELVQFQGFLSWYFGLKFGLLGVYSAGRSVEKINDADVSAVGPVNDNLITRIIKAVKGTR